MNATTTARTWTRGRDDYGRAVHYLTDQTLHTVGVVVKHPLKKAGEPGSYWYCRWDLPYGTPQEIKVVEFSTLKGAKAGLEAACEDDPR